MTNDATKPYIFIHLKYNPKRNQILDFWKGASNTECKPNYLFNIEDKKVINKVIENIKRNKKI